MTAGGKSTDGKAEAQGADKIAAAITTDISAGRFGNGSWLKQAELEARYSCTRADVRRALEMLAVKGVLQRIPQRGYYVTTLDERRHRELVEVRVVLETATVPSIVAAATAADIADLRHLAEQFRMATRQGDAAEKYHANRAFHVRLTGLCGNRELAKLALDVRGHLPNTPIVQWRSQARIERSADEHFQMVEALSVRDAALLRHLITLHIEQPEDPRADG